MGYAVAAFEASGYRPRDEDVYLMYGEPGRMLGRFTLHDDRTLFLFVFVASGTDLPVTPQAQKALLRDLYGCGGRECGKISVPTRASRRARLRQCQPDQIAELVKRACRACGRCGLLRLIVGRQGSALAMIAAYALAGEFSVSEGRYPEAFANYEVRLRSYIASKQRGAQRFAGAFAPKTAAGLYFRNMVIRAFAIPGLARFVIGKDIVDRIELPDFPWPALDRLMAA